MGPTNSISSNQCVVFFNMEYRFVVETGHPELRFMPSDVQVMDSISSNSKLEFNS